MYYNTYSDKKLFGKIKKVFEKAGRELIEKALWLYFVLQKPEVPMAAKSVVISALAYFIWPIDAIPDVLGPVGYTDDLAVISAAIVAVAMHIDESVKQQANKKLYDWFG